MPKPPAIDARAVLSLILGPPQGPPMDMEQPTRLPVHEIALRWQRRSRVRRAAWNAQGRSALGAGRAMSRGAIIPSRALSDCGWPVSIAA
jgi:hypothetical protein